MSKRTAAWLAWSLCGLSVALTMAAGVLAYLSYSAPYRGTATSVGVGGGIGFGLAMLMYPLVGALIASRHPAASIGWMFCAVGVFGGLNAIGAEYASYAVLTHSDPLSLAAFMAWLDNWTWLLPSALIMTFLPLYFPYGRLPSRRWRPVVWLAVVAMIALILNKAFMPGPFENYPSLRNPFGIEGAARLLTVLVEANFLTLIVTLASAVAVILRFRWARGEERLQLKWFVSAVALVVVTMLIGVLVAGLLGVEPMDLVWFPIAMFMALATLPLAVGIAILRYRLYDIDVIINRTLVYGTLTGMLALAYIGSVVALQSLFRTLTGEQSQLAIVASTLAIAALFNPLRRRIQAFIDRRFYRRKYDAAKTLEAFSARLRDETDLDALSNDLLAVVEETLQPEHVSLWLREPEVKREA